ncbi:ribosomal protein S5 domain 2-like protein [Auricularia subglabra TFB-10046 SS5]|nr:ribosomal protein S5 domain 2-like protein [Auricularia subglabra TFB-10046 SS5]
MSKAECSYVRQALSTNPPVRADGRGLLDYRTVSIVRGTIPLANGSARVSIGGTEVLASAKLEVTDADRGAIACNVVCPVSAYPTLAPGALDDLAADHTHVLHSVLGDPSLVPDTLTIIPKKKAWLLTLDLLVMADAGNIYDALFLAARIALIDTRVPRTSPIEYKAPKHAAVGGDDMGMGFSFKREQAAAVDFEVKDYWDEGAPLQGADTWPMCVTLNLCPPVDFLDATLLEETAVPHRVLLMFSFPESSATHLQGTRLLGPGEVTTSQLQTLIADGEKYARKLTQSVDAQLKLQELSMDNHRLPIYTLR